MTDDGKARDDRSSDDRSDSDDEKRRSSNKKSQAKLREGRKAAGLVRVEEYVPEGFKPTFKDMAKRARDARPGETPADIVKRLAGNNYAPDEPAGFRNPLFERVTGKQDDRSSPDPAKAAEAKRATAAKVAQIGRVDPPGQAPAPAAPPTPEPQPAQRPLTKAEQIAARFLAKRS